MYIPGLVLDFERFDSITRLLTLIENLRFIQLYLIFFKLYNVFAHIYSNAVYGKFELEKLANDVGYPKLSCFVWI